MMVLRFLVFLLISLTPLLAAPVANNVSNVSEQENSPSAPLPSNGAAVDEVVVESSLYIKPKAKPSFRRTIRSIHPAALHVSNVNALLSSLVEHKRVKRQPQRNRPQRQPQGQFYGQSQAAANAAANAQHRGPGGFGSSAANALAQAFNAQGPAGSFGASSAGTVTQAQNANKFGFSNSAGASMSQVFHLPNGQTINFASTNNFANAPGANANSRGGAVSVSQG